MSSVSTSAGTMTIPSGAVLGSSGNVGQSGIQQSGSTNPVNPAEGKQPEFGSLPRPLVPIGTSLMSSLNTALSAPIVRDRNQLCCGVLVVARWEALFFQSEGERDDCGPLR